MLKEFEIGPIRPPSEAESLLLRITRNCSWNRCRFCKIYKGQSFRTRPFSEIKEDIDQVAAYMDDIKEWLLEEGALSQQRLREKLSGYSDEVAQRYLYVLNWMFSREKNVFLQDANTMVLSHEKLKQILVYLRERIPEAGRVTSYARVDALCRYTQEELADLREAGLDRIHSGYETGSDRVLTLIDKGYTKEQEIEAGRKVRAAGIELSVYVMPGLGGKELSDENALETADVISKVNPDFVRVRTFVPLPGSGAFEDIQAGKVTECADKEKVQELHKLIENIRGADGRLYSDHIINLLEEVNGSLTEDREIMLAKFEEFFGLPEREQKEYQLARRMGMVRGPGQMALLSLEQRERVSSCLARMTSDEDFEEFLHKHLKRYI